MERRTMTPSDQAVVTEERQKLCQYLSGTCVAKLNPERPPCTPENCAVVHFESLIAREREGECERLREEVARLEKYEGLATSAVGIEIAGEKYYVRPNVASSLTRAQEQIGRLRKALEPFAKAVEESWHDSAFNDDATVYVGFDKHDRADVLGINNGDCFEWRYFRAARTALDGEGK